MSCLTSPLRLVVAAVTILCVDTPAAHAQCPTRVSTAGIRNPDLRNTTASEVVDQSFIAQNGGAQTMLTGVRQQIAALDAVMRDYERCVVQSSDNPAAVRPADNVPGSCAAALEASRDARRALENWVPVLQCWASQPAGGGSRATGGGGTGVTRGRPVTRDQLPGADAIQGLIGAFTDPIETNVSRGTRDDTDWAAVQQRENARQARIASRCGPPVGGGIGLRDMTMQADGTVTVRAGAAEQNETRAREYSSCRERVSAEFDAENPASGGGVPVATFQPLLDAQGLEPARNDTRLNNAINDILNPPSAAEQTTRILFEYEMPRTARPDRDFLKRISGELRSTNGRHEVFVKVGDIDGNWLTTDQCVTLDVSFQATFTSTNGSASRSFPTFSLPINATDGTADVRAAVPLTNDGQPTEVRVTSVAARACGAKAPEPVDCTGSLELRQELLAHAKRLMDRRSEVMQGIDDLEAQIKEIREANSYATSKLTEFIVVANLLNTGVKTALTFFAPIQPSRWPVIIDIGKDVVVIIQKIQDEELPGIAELISGSANASQLADATSRLTEVLGKLSALNELEDAAAKVTQFEALKSTVDDTTGRLSASIRSHRANLATSKRKLDAVLAQIEQLRWDCGITAPGVQR